MIDMRTFAALIAVLGMLAATAANAEPRYRPDRPDRSARGLANRGLSQDEAASRAQRQHGGRVLAVDRDDEGGYRVKLLKNGEVRTVFISP
jgi:uncharacterized membrane protein YkoI